MIPSSITNEVFESQKFILITNNNYSYNILTFNINVSRVTVQLAVTDAFKQTHYFFIALYL